MTTVHVLIRVETTPYEDTTTSIEGVYTTRELALQERKNCMDNRSRSAFSSRDWNIQEFVLDV
jgi:hypothetical protein